MSEQREDLFSIMNTPRGYDPLEKGEPELTEREKKLYLYLYRNKESQYADLLNKTTLLRQGMHLDDVASLERRHLLVLFRSNKYMCFHPDDVKDNHPSVVKERKDRQIKNKAKLNDFFDGLAERIGEIDADKLIDALILLSKGDRK